MFSRVLILNLIENYTSNIRICTQKHIYLPKAKNFKFIETENIMVVARGWKEGETGTFCLMGIECQFGKTDIFVCTV